MLLHQHKPRPLSFQVSNSDLRWRRWRTRLTRWTMPLSNGPSISFRPCRIGRETGVGELSTLPCFHFPAVFICLPLQFSVTSGARVLLTSLIKSLRVLRIISLLAVTLISRFHPAFPLPPHADTTPSLIHSSLVRETLPPFPTLSDHLPKRIEKKTMDEITTLGEASSCCAGRWRGPLGVAPRVMQEFESCDTLPTRGRSDPIGCIQTACRVYFFSFFLTPLLVLPTIISIFVCLFDIAHVLYAPLF